VNAMVVYDSMYGNTGKVAETIASALGSPEDVQLRKVDEARAEQLAGVTLLIVGSPTQKFSPTGATTRLLKSIPNNGLQGVKVAAFDTRFTESEIGSNRILAFFVSIFGYAAEPIAERLKKKGGDLVVPPEGFYVGGTEGPLLEGELERATAWAQEIAGQAP
jgi:flavodoxin